MNEQVGRERDLVLAPNQYAYILDETKGHVIVWVGPTKQSLSNTDRPVTYSEKTKKFERASLESAMKEFPLAGESCYVVLENPAKSGSSSHPKAGMANNLPDLDFGCKINIRGPMSFPVWPGQITQVIEGHQLRSNQYLVVRVYNEKAATENWNQGVIKPQDPNTESPKVESGKVSEKPNLTMGKLQIIKGTDVSFYIPPTGIEVVPDSEGKYVRDAATLESLEYCILLDENGKKRYVHGPAVVFPNPTETFVERKSGSGVTTRKFRAIELNEQMGLHIKVISDYKDDGKDEHKKGDELFVTGKDMRIYFPRAEHAVIKYGENGREINYAVVIPEGEARYVLDKDNGKIELIRGPKLFLADPRKQVIVRRALDEKTVRFWFPGNDEAVRHNLELMQASRGEKYVTEQAVQRLKSASVHSASYESFGATPEAEHFVGDELERNQTFTPPRTITIDTKYDGAVSIRVWTGYSVQVVSKTGERKVVVGPKTYLLEYDETLEVLSLSTGTPKNTDRLLNTVYLLAKHNKVSDVVTAETKDLVKVNIKVSYRVNFEGDENKWFNVENYVKFLCDHMRSKVKNAVKHVGIEEFNNNAINIVRDTVLGVVGKEGEKRPGQKFEENGMHIYDVEVLDVQIGDAKIAQMLVEAQHNAVQNALQLADKERKLKVAQRSEEIDREMERASATTTEERFKLAVNRVEQELAVTVAKVEAEVVSAEKRLNAKRKEQVALGEINEAELSRKKAIGDLDLAVEKAQLDQRLEQLKAEVDAVVEKAKAISPQFVAALQAFADKELAGKMAESMSPLAILGGASIADVLSKLLKGTSLEKVLMNGSHEMATPRI